MPKTNQCYDQGPSDSGGVRMQDPQLLKLEKVKLLRSSSKSGNFWKIEGYTMPLQQLKECSVKGLIVLTKTNLRLLWQKKNSFIIDAISILR